MLSEENKEKLSKHVLYKHEPDVKYRNSWNSRDLYHCCNWTFKIVDGKEDRTYMRDTYWSSGESVHIEVTNRNIDEFIPLFDMRKVKEISIQETNEYDYGVVISAPIGSGGIEYGMHYFVPKDAIKSKARLIKNKQGEIESLKSQLKWAENDLKILLEQWGCDYENK